MDTQQSTGFWQKNKLVIKAVFIGFLTLALLIPTFFIMFLVNDRQSRRDEVVKEVSNKWAGAQTITGPFLSVPYYVEVKDASNQPVLQKRNLYLLPDELSIDGKVVPQIRHRSIFDVPVYNSNLKIEGKFLPLKTEKLPVKIEALHFDEAVMCMGITDFKGIGENLLLTWNDSTSGFETGLPDIAWLGTGINSPLALTASSFSGRMSEFQISLSLKGSERLYVTPFGNTSKVHMESEWSNPAFDGKYLPDTSNLSAKGFTANWKVLHFNRTFPQYFTNVNENLVTESAFGFKLLQPVDAYGQTQRSIKYAVLVISLTFFLYFFLEIFYRRSVHVLQYILIGFALVIFYTLLLSLSEYIDFAKAYLAAAASTVLLIGWYSKSVFKKWNIVLIFSFILSLLYLFIFVLIQLQDYSLLFGSVGLFILLGIIMFFSRKINWNAAGEKQLAEEA